MDYFISCARNSCALNYFSYDWSFRVIGSVECPEAKYDGKINEQLLPSCNMHTRRFRSCHELHPHNERWNMVLLHCGEDLIIIAPRCKRFIRKQVQNFQLDKSWRIHALPRYSRLFLPFPFWFWCCPLVLHHFQVHFFWCKSSMSFP